MGTRRWPRGTAGGVDATPLRGRRQLRRGAATGVRASRRGGHGTGPTAGRGGGASPRSPPIVGGDAPGGVGHRRVSTAAAARDAAPAAPQRPRGNPLPMACAGAAGRRVALCPPLPPLPPDLSPSRRPRGERDRRPPGRAPPRLTITKQCCRGKFDEYSVKMAKRFARPHNSRPTGYRARGRGGRWGVQVSCAPLSVDFGADQPEHLAYPIRNMAPPRAPPPPPPRHTLPREPTPPPPPPPPH